MVDDAAIAAKAARLPRVLIAHDDPELRAQTDDALAPKYRTIAAAAASDALAEAAMDRPAAPAARGSVRGEIVLVVEDDPDVRAFSVETLREFGYTVVEAGSGVEALQRLEDNPAVRLMFTDVGLPGGRTGRELADVERVRWPKLKVLLTTGYARNAIVHHGRLDPGVELIAKPFTANGLATRVRGMLDAD